MPLVFLGLILPCMRGVFDCLLGKWILYWIYEIRPVFLSSGVYVGGTGPRASRVAIGVTVNLLGLCCSGFSEERDGLRLPVYDNSIFERIKQPRVVASRVALFPGNGAQEVLLAEQLMHD